MVVSNCRPGSAQAQAAWLIWSHRSRALTDFGDLAVGAPDQAPVAVGFAPPRMKSSVTRTELLEFWPETVR